MSNDREYWNGLAIIVGAAATLCAALYGSSVTAQAYTLNGDTITEWPMVTTTITNIVNDSFSEFTFTNKTDNAVFTINRSMGKEIFLAIDNVATTITVDNSSWPINGIVRISFTINNPNGQTVTLDDTFIDWGDVEISGDGITTILLRRVLDGKFKALQLELPD